MISRGCKSQMQVFFIALMFLVVGKASAAGDPMLNAKLEEAISKLRAEKLYESRIKLAEQLADKTHVIDPETVDDKTLACMVSLLDDPEDGVRAWVAVALGYLGPRAAKVAAPKLLALLPIADCLEGDLTSAAAIRPALERMGIEPPPYKPENCKQKQGAGPGS